MIIILNFRDDLINQYNDITFKYQKIKEKYLIIEDSIDYYLIMLEVTIYYLKKYSNYNMIKEYQFSKYLKYIYFNNKYKSIDLKRLITSNYNLNFEIVIALLIYPDYYFDIFNKIVNGNDLISNLNKIVLDSYKYEQYIKEINSYLSKKIILYF